RGHGGRMVEATVVELPFYDRTNLRQKVRPQPKHLPLPPGEGRGEGASRGHATSNLPNITSETPRPHSDTFAAGEGTNLAKLRLTDVSALPRLTLKGLAAVELAARLDLPVPEKIYGWRELPGGGVVVRTGQRELFIEDTADGAAIGRLREALATPLPGVVPVWRQDVSLLLSGSEAYSLLAQVCGVNFAALGDDFVMTRLAGVSCSVLTRRDNEAPNHQIWADATFGRYLWTTLLTIARELEGDAV
ncbi:MAG TPA: hypothetical protein VF278_09515, partial [Pirellulales bacterium]